jgi:hypothetical protein
VPAVVAQGDRKSRGALTVVVRNDSGGTVKAPVSVAVLASSDAIADVGDLAVAQASKPLKLKAGESKAVKLKLPLTTVPVGTYQLLGVATVDNLTSSATGPAMRVEAPVVHLVGAGSGTLKPIHAGKKASLSIPLRNDGNVATSKSPATYTLIVSADGTEAGGVYQTSASGRIGLKPSQTKPQKVSIAVPAGAIPAGSYTVLVKVNAESNDTNNQLLAALPVTFL